MSDPNQRLEALRALLYDEPSERAWAKACLALDAWPQDEGLDLGLDYACGLLAAQREAWRAVVDFVPGRWAGDRSAGLPEPRWAVVEALALERWSAVLIAPAACVLGWPHDDPRRQPRWEAHPVTLTRPFLLCVEPVRRVLWEQVQDGAREPWIEERARAPDLSREEDLPETGQPWASTLAFCNRLSSWCELAPAYQFGLDDARNVVTWRGLDHEGWRLPTEAEWELACRAGWGEPPSWSYPGPAREDLFPAREAPPNRLGLFGMKGLALEWVWDAPSGDHTSASADPTGPLVVSASRPMPRRDRILKGALFSAAADSPQWHPAWRSSMLEATAYEGIAFRCARSLLLD